MLISRRAKAIYVAITVVFVLIAFGFAAAGIWAVALACLGMGGIMAGASRGMKVLPKAPAPPE